MAGDRVINRVLDLWDRGATVSQISRKVSLSRDDVSTIVSKYRGGHDAYRKWCIDMRIGSQELLEAIRKERQQAHGL